jgi:hypothetical protein
VQWVGRVDFSPHPEFGSSVNPITTRGADYAHYINASPPGFENPAAALLGIYNFGCRFDLGNRCLVMVWYKNNSLSCCTCSNDQIVTAQKSCFRGHFYRFSKVILVFNSAKLCSQKPLLNDYVTMSK